MQVPSGLLNWFGHGMYLIKNSLLGVFAQRIMSCFYNPLSFAGGLGLSTWTRILRIVSSRSNCAVTLQDKGLMLCSLNHLDVSPKESDEVCSVVESMLSGDWLRSVRISKIVQEPEAGRYPSYKQLGP